MPSSYTTNLGIEKPATGEQSGTWGGTVNLNYDLFDQAINGVISITLPAAGSSGSPKVLAITDGAVSDGRNKFIEFVDGGDLGATAYVQLTPNDAEKIVHIRNSLSGGRSVIVFQGTYNASNDFEIPNGKDVVLKFDGAGTGAVVSDVFVDLQATAVTTPSLTVGTSATFAGTTVADLGSVTTADINGGTLDGVIIGGASAAAATVTDLTASGTVDFSGVTVSDLGTVTTADIDGGTFDGVAIGGTTPAAGAFTTLSATGNVTLGDASGDSITVNAGTMTLANDLSINSGTYVFDQTNSRLGVRIATPRVPFQVQGDVMIGDDLGSAGSGDLKLYRGSGVDPLIRLYSSTNDSFIQGGATLKFGAFAGSGTTVDMELDANGNLNLENTGAGVGFGGSSADTRGFAGHNWGASVAASGTLTLTVTQSTDRWCGVVALASTRVANAGDRQTRLTFVTSDGNIPLAGDVQGIGSSFSVAFASGVLTMTNTSGEAANMSMTVIGGGRNF